MNRAIDKTAPAAPDGHYRVIERLATGGMAEVFLAEALGLADFSKPVAIKRVLPHLAENEKFIGMFLDEARLSAKLNHRNIAQVFDVGHVENSYFIVMEYVDGATIKSVLEQMSVEGRSMPLEIAMHIGVEVCNGLHYAHQLSDRSSGALLGIVHRDVSPANVLVSRFGGVKIVDFGLAKAASQLERTDPGVLKGKFGYLAPETAAGDEADFTADIFAVGIMLWEMVAQRRLFVGQNDWDTLQMVRRAIVPKLREFRPDVPEALEAVILKSLSREKSDRFATAADMSRALTKCLYQNGVPFTAEDLGTLVREATESARAAAAASASTSDLVVSPLINEQVRKLSTHSVVARPPTSDSSGDAIEVAVAPAVIRAAVASEPAEESSRVSLRTPAKGVDSLIEPDGFSAASTPAAPVASAPIEAVTHADKAGDEAPVLETSGVSEMDDPEAIDPPPSERSEIAKLPPGAPHAVPARASRGGFALRIVAIVVVAGLFVAVAMDLTHMRGAHGPAALAGSIADRNGVTAADPSGAPRTENPAAIIAPATPAEAPAALPSAAPATAQGARSSGRLDDSPSVRARFEMRREMDTRVHACELQFGHHRRHARVYVTYDGATGSASNVSIIGTYFTGTPVGDCIIQAVRSVPAPPFASEHWNTDYVFMIN